MSRFDDIYKKRKNETYEDKNKTQEESESRFDLILSNVNNGSLSSDIDDDFVNNFLSDSQKYIKQAYKDYDGLSWKSATSKYQYESRDNIGNDLISRSAMVRTYLNSNKNSIDEDTYNDLISYLDYFGTSAVDIYRAFSNAKSYYSNWDTEEDYLKSARSGDATAYRQNTYTENINKIAELEEYYDDHSNIEGWYTAYLMNPYAWDEETVKTNLAKYNDLVSKYGSIDGVEAEIDRLKTENNLYERGEGGYTSKVVDDYHGLLNKTDFTDTSANRDYDNPTREELIEYDTLNDSSRWYYGADGVYRDAFGNELTVDKNGNWANQKASDGKYQVVDRLGMYLNSSDEEIQEALGIPSGLEGTWETVLKDGVDGSWGELTENEISIYYYLLNTDGQQTADKYLSDMKTELNRRETLKSSQGYEKAYNEANILEKIAFNLATFPAQLFSSVSGTIENTANTLAGNEINPYSAAHSGMHYSNTVRGATAADLDKTGFKIPIVNFSLGDIYQSVMSIGDSQLAMALGGPTIGGLLLATGAAENEAYRLYQQGASQEQVVLGAVAAGAMEMIFERISLGELDKIKNMKSPKTIGQFFKTLLVQGGVEMSEEMATEIGNLIANAYIMGSQSDWEQKLKDNGGNLWAAIGDEAIEVLNAGIGGFISGVGSGAIVGGASYIGNKMQNNRQNTNIGNKILKAGGVDALRDLANNMAGVTNEKTANSLRKQAGNVSNQNTKRNSRKVGELYNTVKNALGEQNQADIAKSLERKGYLSQDASAIAEALVADLNGNHLTEEQQNLLKKVESDSRVQQTIRDVVNNVNSTMNQRNQNMDDFVYGVAIINAIKSQMKSGENGEKNGVSVSETESTYDVSADGKTVLKSTGEDVSIREVASVKDGKMTLRLEDGSEVSSEDVSYASRDEALVYETVANMGVNASEANVLVNAFHTGNVDAYIYTLGIQEAYRYGKYNYTVQEMLGRGSFASMLTEHQRQTAYKLGQVFSGRETAKAQAEVRSKQTGSEKNANSKKDSNAKNGGVMYEGRDGSVSDLDSYLKDSGKELKPIQKTAIQTMKMLSDVFGIKFYVFESYKNSEGKRVWMYSSGKEGSINGYYDQSDGSIHIDLNAGADGKGTMLFTMAHELTHFIKQWSPAKFKVLANFLMKQYGEKGVSVDALVRKRMKKTGLGYDDAYEEVVANSMESMLSDGNVTENLVELKKQDKGLWNKIRQFINSWVDKLRAAYKGLTPDSVEGKIVYEMKDAAERLQALFAEALADAGENYQAAGSQKNTANDGGVKLMSRNDSTRIKAQIDSVSSKLNQMDVVVSIKTDGFVGMKKSDIARSIEKEYAKFGNRVDRQNFGIILLEYNQINKALEYLNTDGEKAALLTVPRVLKRGVMADSHTEHKDRGVDSVTFAAPVEINGKRGNVGVVVQRVAGTNRFKTLRILLPNGKAFEFVQNKEADSTSGSSSKQKVSEGIPIESASGDIIRSEKEIVKKKFAMREPVEYTKDLVALHNLTEDKLAKALELGGFPMPSIAVTKSDIPHTNFGDITLVFGRETIDPKESKKNTVYSADAWTPTFPRVEYEENRDVGNRISGQLDGISKKVDEFFQRDLRMVYTDLEGNLNRYGGEEGLIQHAMENYGLKAAYLEEQGKHIEQVTAQAEADLGFNPESAEKYRKIMDILGVSDADAIGKLNLKETREKYGAELEKAFPGITKSPFRMSRIFSQVQKYLNNKDAGPVYETVTDANATKKAVDDALDMEDFEAWTRNLFSGIEKDSGVYNQKDIFTPAGNRRSFQQTHLPFTLDNIVKAMAAQNGGNTKNVAGFNGIKTLRAGTAERFKSIADMHKREGRLQNLTEEQLQDIQDSLQSRLFSVMEAIDKENGERGESNSLIRYDSIGQIIMEISEGGKYNVADIQNVFRQYTKEISDDTALEVKQLLYDVSQMPVNIFEAKPERAVRFDEVKAAILPEGTDQRIVDGLTNNGVPVQFYESGNNDERLKIVNSMDNLKFQDREDIAGEDGSQKNRRAKGAFTPAEIQAIQSIGRKSIHSFTSADIKATEKFARRYWQEMGKKSPFFRAWFGDWRVNDHSLVQVADQIDNDRGVQRNEDTGWDIQVSGKVFDETNNHKSIVSREARQYLPYINDIVRKAVLLDSFGQGKTKSENSLLMHSLYTVADIGNGPEILKLYVEEMNDPNADNTTKRSYQLQNIEKAFAASGRVQGNAPSSVTNTANTIRTVADLFAAVKRMDTNFIPNSPSKIVNADGTPKVMYHGSQAQFTVFDKRKAKGSGLYGRGFYFTDSKSHAGTYGNLYAVYLNIKNPLQYGGGNVSREQVKLFLDAVSENEDYSIENYGTYDTDSIVRSLFGGKSTIDAFQVIQDINATAIGDFVEAIAHFNQVNGTNYDGIVTPTETVAFYSNQIKSATDNIGTFDGSNPDILLQDRPEESVSNRSLLANALESTAKDDTERKKIQEYKEKIELLNAEEHKLQDLNAQVKELSFAKGPRDKAKIRALRDEAVKTANRINTYDRILLRLEASSVLQNVLEREKKAAYKKAEQKGKEALEEYRKDAMKKQQDILDRWQKSREKGIDSRNRTAMRHKIQNVVAELNQYLLKGTKDRHVPIELQKAVAEALDAVNMDTVGAEERIAKLKEELLKAKTAEQIQKISRKIDNIQAMGDRMNDRLQALKDAYDKFTKSDDPLIANSHDDVISAKLDSVIDTVGNTPLRDMSLSQLKDVYDMYRMVLTTIRNANKAFKAKKNESISAMGNEVMMEVERAGGKTKLRLKGTGGISNFDWNNMKPVYAFERIGSDTLTELFNNVRAGEDTWAVDVTEAREYFLEKAKKYNYDSWDFNSRYTFTSASGMEFSLSLEQILSLYAYSKREQADQHLKLGGIVFDETTEVTMKTKLGIPLKFNPTEATAYNISENTLADIIGKLSDEQKGFADEMQDYLSSVMGSKGNEVSLELYGIKLFNEKFYFPLKSAKQFMEKAREQQQGDAKIKNKGFSKDTVPKASNPIVLTPFMDVWADHVNEMSMYHAFVLPMEDFYRVYNFKTPVSETEAEKSVNMFLQNAYGKGATNYIDQLLKDLNGGARSDPRENTAKVLMSKFKKAAVMASLSVVIQQPSAIARAFAVIDPKYFRPTKDGMNHSQLWEELKKYAPVAVIKEMGYFDTNMGRSTNDFIKAKKYTGFKEKVKALFKDSGYRDELISKAPSLADEVTWCAIWNAVKRETVSKHHDLSPGSDEFLKLAGERFTEVITKTQVYDSVLARSGNMRSKTAFMNMWTSFMAEPTTSINMVQDALLKAKRGDKWYAVKAIGSVCASVILNAALVSLVYAMRDDDDDETYLEKYVSRFLTETLDGLNPLTYIPFLRDVWSVMQGFDIDRADMSLVTDLVNSLQKIVKVMNTDTYGMDEDEIAEHNRNVAEAWLSAVDSISSLTGIPFRNFRRDLNGAVNLVKTLTKDAQGRQTTAGSLMDVILDDVKASTPIWGWMPGESKADKLYDAIVSGDTAYVDRLKSGYVDKYGEFDKSKYESALRKSLRENDPRIKEAAEARFSGDFNRYKTLFYEIKDEGYFDFDTIMGAINNEVVALEMKANGYTKTESTQPDYYDALFDVEHYYAAIVNNDQAAANIIYDDLIAEKVAEGYLTHEAKEYVSSGFTTQVKNDYLKGEISRSRAVDLLTEYTDNDESKVKEWDFQIKYGFSWSERVRKYRLGELSEQDLISAVMDIEGESREAAEAYIDFLDLEMENDDTNITSSDAYGYFKYAKPAGIDIKVYMDYKDKAGKCESDKDKNGNAISGSKKKKIMEVIDSLPITKKQKDALYYANGWSASSIYEAPWRR